ncbi:MAG: ABC transporter permease [Clostridia bacterium]|nr:ABC transporter permease [Clostridia bacterium]
MKTLCASYRNELDKLFVNKKYTVFLVIGILICMGKIGVLWAVGAVSKGTVNLKISNLALEMLPFFAEVLVPLVVFMAATDLMCTEIQDNTMKAMLLRPVSRFKLLISKTLAAFTVGAVNFIVILIACTVLEAIFGDASKLWGYVGNNAAAYLIDLIPLFVLVLMAMLVNLISKSSTLAMFLCFLIYAVMKYCNYFVIWAGSALFTSYSQWHKLWIGTAIPFSAMSSKIFLLIGSAIVFFTAAYYLFDKRDF